MSHRRQPQYLSPEISLFKGDVALSIIGGRRNINKLSSALRPIEVKRVQFEDSMETGEVES